MIAKMDSRKKRRPKVHPEYVKWWGVKNANRLNAFYSSMPSMHFCKVIAIEMYLFVCFLER